MNEKAKVYTIFNNIKLKVPTKYVHRYENNCGELDEKTIESLILTSNVKEDAPHEELLRGLIEGIEDEIYGISALEPLFNMMEENGDL